MKKQNFSVYAFVAIVSATAVACNPLSNMTKKAEEVTYSVNPTPLEMHGDSVDVQISGTIPPKFFNKKVSVEITPTSTSEGGDVTFKKLVLVGEDSEIEGQKISFDKGGSFSYNDKIAYDDKMEVSTFNAVAVGKYKGKEKSFPARQVGSGTIITPKWVKDQDLAIIGADKFTRVVPMEKSATVNYMVNKSNVTSSEKSDDDMKELSAWVKEMSKNPMFAFKTVSSEAYASPEGELSLNTNLADNRAESGSSAINSILRRNKVKLEAAAFTKTGKGEDWAGFKSAMQATDIKDKDLILRVLEMNPDKAKREEEIRNMAATFVELQDKILPQLRRSEVVIKGELTAYSDEQIKEFAKTAPDTLTVEELLYAATMTDDLDEKMMIYSEFAKLHAKDWRGPNNVGYIYVMQNKMEKAKAEFDKANSLSPNNPVINNNLGVYERANGNDEKAMEFYSAATGAGPAVGNNIGYLQIKDGNYVDAVSNYGSIKSFNAALAQTLNKDYTTALQTIDGSASLSGEALGSYLKAIIGARTKDAAMLVSNLKAAISIDPALKDTAKKDAEFTDFRENAEFQAATN
jgi:tetratricopeptide (TPR) repeat protein